MAEKKWQDDELGIITIVVNPRAKRYSLRVKNGSVWGVIPAGGSEKVMKEFIRENRQRLRTNIERFTVKKDILSDTTDLQTYTFKLHIFRTERTDFYMTLKDGILHIACPQVIRFEEDQVQQILKKMLERAFRHEAKRILPQRLQALAGQYNFSYSTVKINNSKSRWGSCNSKGSINLSLSLMMLPDKLIDYVLLHELCHTREMNHSVRFWQLMDTVTANQARQLRRELKNYQL